MQFSVGDSNNKHFRQQTFTFTPVPINPQIDNSSNFTLQALVLLLEIHLNSPKCLLYWNFISGSDFKHITAVCLLIILHQSAKFMQVRPPWTEKNAAISIFKMAVLHRLGFYGFVNGFFEKPMYFPIGQQWRS